MKFQLICALLGICIAAAVVAQPAPAAMTPIAPQTLGLELEELYRLIPTKQLSQLITRYLLNDAEFQAVIRTINSQDAFFVRMRFRSQPEVITFVNWVRSQLLHHDGSLELIDSEELIIFNKIPYWANSVYGWQGFVNEFLAYYQQDVVRSHIDMKVAQNGVFAQYWARLKALKPAYERVLAFPETRRVIAQLQALGVNTDQLEHFIRTQFDWINGPAIYTAAAPVAP